MKQTLVAVVVIIVLGAGGWYLYSTGAFKGMGAPATSSTTATSTSTTVATVNGQAITYGQLMTAEQQVAAQAGVSATSTDPTIKSQLQTQALDSLINQALLVQATQQGGYTASSTQVDAQLASVKTQFGSEAAYQQALSQQGLTEAQLRSQISQSLAIQAYLEATVGLSKATASATEIQTMYDQVKAQQGTSTPALSKVKSQVEQLVINQKQQQLVSAQVAKLRAAASVQISI